MEPSHIGSRKRLRFYLSNLRISVFAEQRFITNGCARFPPSFHVLFQENGSKRFNRKRIPFANVIGSSRFQFGSGVLAICDQTQNCFSALTSFVGSQISMTADLIEPSRTVTSQALRAIAHHVGLGTCGLDLDSKTRAIHCPKANVGRERNQQDRRFALRS